MKSIKIFLLFLLMAFFSCTKLDETFRSELEENNAGNISAAQLLTTAYDAISGTFQTGDFWHISQHTTDETIGPTRGPDWDDNGQWRALHAHTWNPDHGIIGGAFTGLLGAQFAASNVLQYNPSAQQKAEARFIRALSIFSVLDGWDQVPYRENLIDYKVDPKTLKGTEAADFIITELTEIINDLPGSGPSYVANKNAARALLMKVYLNKGAFANRAAPTFPAADMTQVVTLADQITGYTIATNKYFDNFAPNNDAVSTENIFTFYNKNGDRGQNIVGTWFSMAHYNMDPGGWNGFATLSDFYNKFEAADQRLGSAYAYPGAQPNPGNRRNVGFLIGQQYNLTTDAALNDRGGSPLVFTPEVKIKETGSNLEVTGIRVDKYAYDYAHKNSQGDNDWAYLRYSDVLLMKAEALLRNGNAAGGLTIVNTLRAARGATPLASLTLDNLLDERGRELYYEGWRRQDLIRFGKYLNAWQEKAADNGPRNLLFPIPSSQLAVNPNLTQNPGYN
jgi:hypothetical protein